MANKRKGRDDGGTSGRLDGPKSAAVREAMVRGDNRASRLLALEVLAEPGCSEEERALAREMLDRTGLDRPTLAASLGALALVATLIGTLVLA